MGSRVAGVVGEARDAVLVATIAKPAEDGDPGSPAGSSFPVREGTFGAGGSDLRGGVDGGKLNAFASLAQLVEQLTLNQ